MQVTRHVAASAGDRRIYGRSYRRPLPSRTWWQRLLGIRYERGTFLEMASLDKDTALQAFEEAMAGRGVFSIEASFGGTLEFHPIVRSQEIWVDCWFFDANLSEFSISRDGAEHLISLLFTDCAEHDVLRLLGTSNANVVPMA
jgi:hypothetical protein